MGGFLLRSIKLFSLLYSTLFSSVGMHTAWCKVCNDFVSLYLLFVETSFRGCGGVGGVFGVLENFRYLGESL